MTPEQIILEMFKAIEPQLFWLLIQGMGAFFAGVIVTGIIKQLAIYVRLRVSDIFSVRMPIDIDGFKGVIQEITYSGIFIKNDEGVTKFIPLSRWQYCDIKFPDLSKVLKNKDDIL